MAFKITGLSNTGDATHHGPADIDKYSKFLSGYDLSITEPVDIATQTNFRSSKLLIRNPSNTYSFKIAGTDGGPGGDITLTIPLPVGGATTDTFVLASTAGAGSGDMVLANVQTVTGAKTFNDTKLLLRNPANTFSATLGAGAQTAARTFTFPVTTSDEIQTIAATQTVTNKTLNVDANTLKHSTTNAAGDIWKSDGTKMIRLARGTANQVLAVNAGGTDIAWATGGGGGGSGDMLLGTAQTVTAAKTFNDTTLLLRNPADTFSVTLGAGAQTAARTFTFPVTTSDTIVTIAATQTLTGKTLTTPVISSISNTGTVTLPTATDTLVARTTTDTLTNKTINATNNSITDTSTALGDVLKSDGTKFARFAKGTANQVLAVNGAGTDLTWVANAAGASTSAANTWTAVQTFNDTDFALRNPANTFSATIAAGAQTAARTFTFPVTTSDTIETIAATQTVSNKTLSVDLNTLNHSTTNAAGDILKSDGTKLIRLGRGTANQVLAVNAGGTDLAWTTLAGATIQPDYVVYKSGANYVAMDTTGTATTNTSFTTLINGLNSTLGSAGGSIFIKAGTYDVDGSGIVISNSISLIGAGRGKTILRRTMAVTGGILWLQSTASNYTFASLTVDGNYPTNTSNTFGEVGLDGSNVLCTDLEFKAFRVQGLAANGGSGVLISNCIFTGANTLGVSAFGIWSDAASNQLTISKCIFKNCDLNAIFCGGKTQISDCYFSGNALSNGGQITNGSSAIITTCINCVFDAGGTGSSGIEMESGEWIVIGNRLTTQRNWGIVTNTTVLTGITVSKNVVKNSQTAPGIQIQGSQQNFTVEGNVCYDDQVSKTQIHGIYIDPGCSRYVLKNNVCYNNTLGQITDMGTSLDKVVSDNIPYIAAGQNTALSPVIKRSGSYQPAGGNTATTAGTLYGALGAHTVVAGGTNSTTFDAVEGMIANLQSAATANVNTGLVSPTSGGQYRTAFSVKAICRVKMGSTTGSRFFFGFAGVATLPISDTPLATAIPGILVGWSTADTNFVIRQNDAAGAVTITNITGPIAKNTSWHTIEINWDGAGTAVNAIFDGTAQTLATNIPPTTSDLWFNCVGQTSTTTQQTLSVHGVWVEAAK